MANNASFTGSVSIHIIEATGLRAVTLPGGKTLAIMDPYVVIDFDNIFFGRTLAKPKTVNPVWGETLTESVDDVQMLQFTLFHSSLIPPDNFIAHAQIYISEMMQLNQQGHEEHEVCTILFAKNRIVIFYGMLILYMFVHVASSGHVLDRDM